MTDDRQEPPAEDADATRAMRWRGGEDVDATRAMRSPGGEDVDATRAMPSDAEEATRRMPRGGDPERQERAGGPTPLPPVPPAWSGRAGVPPPRPAGPETDWYTEEQAGRRWWMPILLGILALVLIALIGVGVWLALRATERDSGPGPSPSAVPTTAAETSAAPTTNAPTNPPATTAPAEMAMPPLVGLPEAAARALLDRLGVDYRVVRQPSDQPEGTVIDSDPPAGEPVAEGDQVTIVVAEPAEQTTGARRRRVRPRPRRPDRHHCRRRVPTRPSPAREMPRPSSPE